MTIEKLLPHGWEVECTECGDVEVFADSGMTWSDLHQALYEMDWIVIADEADQSFSHVCPKCTDVGNFVVVGIN